MAARAVAVFVRLPSPGSVKTRLAAGVGDDGAASFYRACAERTVAAACGCGRGRARVWSAARRRGPRPRPHTSCPDVDVTVAYSPPGAGEAVRAWLAPVAAGARFEPQADADDLGDRMRAALQAQFNRGAARVRRERAERGAVDGVGGPRADPPPPPLL